MENTVVVGDCLQVLPTLPAGCATLVLTSPPYNAGKEYEENATLEDYRGFARAWSSLIPRLVTPTGSFWLNVGYTKVGANETLPLTYLYHPLISMPMIQEVVWHYEGGMSYKRRFTHRTERWMWFSHTPDGVLFDLDAVRDMSLNRTKDKRNNPLGKNPTDYWYFDRVVAGTGSVVEKTNHPCQFPEKMIERIIRACSRPGDLVLDPFSGSGTTCAVARRMGRRYLGIEKDARYAQESLSRIDI
jgi:adenine-specific DNA-methyltransferase